MKDQILNKQVIERTAVYFRHAGLSDDQALAQAREVVNQRQRARPSA